MELSTRKICRVGNLSANGGKEIKVGNSGRVCGRKKKEIAHTIHSKPNGAYFGSITRWILVLILAL